MKNVHLSLLIILMVALSAFTGTAQDQADSEDNGYSLDPTLNERVGPSKKESTSIPFSVKSREDQTNLLLDTPLPFTPYLGASKLRNARPDNMPPHPDDRRGKPLDNYHLEAGVGVPVTDKANLSLGYRFRQSPSLLDESISDPSRPDNNLHFSFDIKLPFK